MNYTEKKVHKYEDNKYINTLCITKRKHQSHYFELDNPINTDSYIYLGNKCTLNYWLVDAKRTQMGILAIEI